MNQSTRIKKLEEYNVLDTLPEKEFDDIVDIASAICNAPISLITLLDSQRQWFKARRGFDKQETPIEQAFCFYAIQRPQEVMVVPDSWKDDRFNENVLAHAENPVRFYAGAPLVTNDGVALGTLCVIDSQPRQFTEEQQRILKILAARVIKQLDLRRDNIAQRKKAESATLSEQVILQRLLEVQRLAEIGSWDWNLSTNELYWSPEMYRLFGLNADNQITVKFDQWQNMVHPDDFPLIKNALNIALKTGESATVEYRVKKLNGEIVWLMGGGKVSKEANNNTQHLMGTALNITARKNAEQNKEHYTIALEEMLFAISHKFRKPVANIFGLVNVLSNPAITPEKIHECVPYLKGFADEIDSYIRELNSFVEQKQTHMSENDK